MPIINVTASGFEPPNIPANVLDYNLNTRWSNLGIGSFIEADLGAQKTICSLDIAWYRGDVRENSFVISVSNDGNGFTPVFTGKSSGTTLSAQKYQFAEGEVTARFVRITVNGNTENNWASVTELGVDGSSTSTPPSPSTTNGNIPPTVHDIHLETNAGTPVQINLSGSDPDGDTLTFSLPSLPEHGGLTAGSSPSNIRYIPNQGFTGSDS